ncbi:MAG: hypothetical protein LHV68_06605 [Elusimicrobia bacterium]|nr:hypothetical protein [Candidatus Liberimonas magnetica]
MKENKAAAIVLIIFSTGILFAEVNPGYVQPIPAGSESLSNIKKANLRFANKRITSDMRKAAARRFAAQRAAVKADKNKPAAPVLNKTDIPLITNIGTAAAKRPPKASPVIPDELNIKEQEAPEVSLKAPEAEVKPETKLSPLTEKAPEPETASGSTDKAEKPTTPSIINTGIKVNRNPVNLITGMADPVSNSEASPDTVNNEAEVYAPSNSVTEPNPAPAVSDSQEVRTPADLIPGDSQHEVISSDPNLKEDSLVIPETPKAGNDLVSTEPLPAEKKFDEPVTEPASKNTSSNEPAAKETPQENTAAPHFARPGLDEISEKYEKRVTIVDQRKAAAERFKEQQRAAAQKKIAIPINENENK